MIANHRWYSPHTYIRRIPRQNAFTCISMRGVAYADSLGMIGTMQTDETAKSRIQYEFAKCMYAIKFLPLSLSLLSLSISHMCDVFVCTCATDATMSAHSNYADMW